MANKTLFSSIKSKFTRTDTVNEAGGRAYKFTPKHALAQMAATGCFNGVYYGSAESQLDEMRKLIDQVDDNVFLAKLAVYARERAYMKDMPAALLVVLSKRDTELLHRAFAYGRQGATGVLSEWQTFVANQQRMGVSSPKLVCIDIQPYGSTQAPERDDRRGRFHSGHVGQLENDPIPRPVLAQETALGGLNIGGFSDAVFHVVASYLSDDAARFVAEVESIEL